MTAPAVLVVDASTLVAALGSEQADGPWATSVLTGARLAAPQLMPYEAAVVFRRLELAGVASAAESTASHRDLRGMVIDLWPHGRLADRAWELRHTVAYSDACYVALAELLDAPLVTLDRRLARAPGPACAFLTPPGPGPPSE